MSDPVTKMDTIRQQSVDEHQLVLRAGAHSRFPRPGGKPALVTLMPQRTDLDNEIGDHSYCQARDPPVADDRCTSRIPHHPPMINHQGSTSDRQLCTSSFGSPSLVGRHAGPTG